MLFINRLYLVLLLFICLASQCLSSTPPRGTKKEINQALAAAVRALSFGSDDEDDTNQHGSARTPPRTGPRGPFSDEEDEGRGASSSGTNSAISGQSLGYRRPAQLVLDESESDEDGASVKRAETSGTSGVGSDSPSVDQSDSDRSRLIFEQSVEGEDGGTLVGLESPVGPKMAGGTPTLGLGGRSKLYTRHGWKKSQDESNKFLARTPEVHQSPNKHDMPETPSYGSASFSDFQSPPRNGPLGSGSVASLNELYHTPVVSFNLNRNLWPPEDRRYIKAAKPPPAPGSMSLGILSVVGREIPVEFLQAVEYGRKYRNKALSTMKWKKTFISGNSANVFGIELNGENLILKTAKHDYVVQSPDDEIPHCVEEHDIQSLHQSADPCGHKPKNGLNRKRACSAEPHLVPFEYYIAEKAALTRGLMPAAASIPKTFGKDERRWYLIFEEIPGISPLKYGDNILERLAKPLIRQQLEALEQIATCHIMHLDAHWGNILYSRERGIQLIDFGLATLVDRFELSDYKATLIITFTLDRCLDCEASKLGREFQQLVKGHYPVDGHALLSHPWLQY